MGDKAEAPNASRMAYLEHTIAYLSCVFAYTKRITVEPGEKKSLKNSAHYSANFDNSLCVHIPTECF